MDTLMVFMNNMFMHRINGVVFNEFEHQMYEQGARALKEYYRGLELQILKNNKELEKELDEGKDA